MVRGPGIEGINSIGKWCVDLAKTDETFQICKTWSRKCLVHPAANMNHENWNIQNVKWVSFRFLGQIWSCLRITRTNDFSVQIVQSPCNQVFTHARTHARTHAPTHTHTHTHIERGMCTHTHTCADLVESCQASALPHEGTLGRPHSPLGQQIGKLGSIWKVWRSKPRLVPRTNVANTWLNEIGLLARAFGCSLTLSTSLLGMLMQVDKIDFDLLINWCSHWCSPHFQQALSTTFFIPVNPWPKVKRINRWDDKTHLQFHFRKLGENHSQKCWKHHLFNYINLLYPSETWPHSSCQSLTSKSPWRLAFSTNAPTVTLLLYSFNFDDCFSATITLWHAQKINAPEPARYVSYSPVISEREKFCCFAVSELKCRLIFFTRH